MHTEDADTLVAAAMAAFDAVVAAADDFRPRPGQRKMAEEAARAFAAATLGETEGPPQRRIAVIQAGTGVGKSAAYNAVGIAIAKKRRTKLLIASSTVALQEQLVLKDLPLLAKHMPQSFTFAMAKGRNRYVCKQRLLRRALIETEATDLVAVEDDPVEVGAAAEPAAQRVKFYKDLAQALESGWDGDRDSLPAAPSSAEWAAVGAERHTCTVRACPHFYECAYYKARKSLAQADVIVANHDLVLASIGGRTLPDLQDVLIVFDEAHALPQKAIHQFAAHANLTRVGWLDKLPRALLKVSTEIGHPLTFSPEAVARELKVALSDTGRLLWDLYSSQMADYDGARRLGADDLAGELHEPIAAINSRAVVLDAATGELAQAIRERIKQAPENNARWSALYSLLGAFAPRLAAVSRTSELLLTEGEDARQLARWCSVDRDATGQISVLLNACPILPGELLALNLWHRVRACVATSATIRSCASFDFFLGESGLRGDPAVKTLAVESPFDYRRQGELVVRKTLSAPRDAGAYNQEASRLLARDLQDVKAGALVLFTSRKHMQQAFELLPQQLRERVLVQGVRGRADLLAEHRRRVGIGLPSVIFGLQALGEGIDLPGRLCEALFVMKLPFQPPTDPVSQARAEFVQAEGGNPFGQLAVPAAGVRMLQWTGRGIRTESDRATITCFDRRLTETSFGKRILAGLPPYSVRVVAAQQSSSTDRQVAVPA